MARTGEETDLGEETNRPLGDRFPFLREHGLMRIDELAWPTNRIAIQAQNALKRGNIVGLATVAEMTDRDLLATRQFGRVCLDMLYQALEATLQQWEELPILGLGLELLEETETPTPGTRRVVTIALGDEPVTVIVRNSKTGEWVSTEGTEVQLEL